MNKANKGKISKDAEFGSLKGLGLTNELLKMREEDEKAEIERDKMYDELFRKIRSISGILPKTAPPFRRNKRDFG